MDRREFLQRALLDAPELERLVEMGHLLPHQQGADWTFSEIDLARALLVQDLKRDLGVNDEGVGAILDLLDQLHGLRRTLREFAAAFASQPEPMRRRIVAVLGEAISSARGPAPGHPEDWLGR
jgi:chaperone modulatory protein CbpM